MIKLPASHKDMPASQYLRITLRIMLPLIITFLFLIAINHWRNRQVVSAQTQQAARQLGDTVLSGLRHAMFEKDGTHLRQVVEDIASMEDVQRLLIVDPAGRITLDTHDTTLGRLNPEAEAGCTECHTQTDATRANVTALSSSTDTLRVSIPIANSPECQSCHQGVTPHLGVLLLDVSRSSFDSHWLGALKRDLGIYALVILIATIGGYRISHHLILKRVASVTHTTSTNTDRHPRSNIQPVHALAGRTHAITRRNEETISPSAVATDPHVLRKHAIVDERKRIAREIHDHSAQLMGYVGTKAGAITLLLEMGRIEEARHQLQELCDGAQQAFLDVRSTILGLRTDVDGNGGLADALKVYANKFRELSEMNVDLNLAVDRGRVEVPEDFALQLLRITQEALANVKRHAATDRVRLNLSLEDRMLRLTIEDDGCGFDPSLAIHDQAHFGLSSMRERAECIGADFHLDTAPGRGTRITVQLPVEMAP